MIACPLALYIALGPDEDVRELADRSFFVPTLSVTGDRGKTVFAEKCAECHGSHGEGSDHGPPLLHPMYGRESHPDAAFRRAVMRGVEAYRWPFGDMPVSHDMNQEDIDSTLTFVREMQEANGIR